MCRRQCRFFGPLNSLSSTHDVGQVAITDTGRALIGTDVHEYVRLAVCLRFCGPVIVTLYAFRRFSCD